MTVSTQQCWTNSIDPGNTIDEREREREWFLFTILSILILKNRVWMLLWKLFNPIICASHVDHFVYDYTTSHCLWEREREGEREREFTILSILTFEESSVNAFMEAF